MAGAGEVGLALAPGQGLVGAGLGAENGRPDVLPADDFGIRQGFRIAFNRRKLPEPEYPSTAYDWTLGCVATGSDLEIQVIADFVRERQPVLVIQ